ncbi:MAG: GNAT family N-acetyltransferase [Clostridiales bacterium]|jgi:predicted acetyltransferase|nr:GNAT family N-acetyltransferase [Clostridiales bacterium]
MEGITHCGECEALPCDKLRAYSYDDPEHGDKPPGARIERCRRWAADKPGLRLIRPEQSFMDSYLDVCRGYKELGVKHHFPDPDEFEIWGPGLIRRFEDDRLGINLKDGYVPASAFWLVMGGEVIGEGNIRHSLTPVLERFGGHIGYAVRAGRWGMGYGSVLLALLLKEAEKLNIKNALITCNEENIASRRVIEKNNGVYIDTVDNTYEGEQFKTRRYMVLLGY